VQAGVLGGAQGHHLHDGDGDVGARRRRLVAPAALAVLTADNQVHRLLEDWADLVVAGLAPQLGQGQRRHGVAVHVAAAGADEVAVNGARGGDQEAGALGDLGAELPLVGQVALGHEGEQGEGGDGGVVGVTAVAPGAVGVLACGQPLQRAGGRTLGLVIHLDVGPRRRRTAQPEQQQDDHGREATIHAWFS
jgi:hypothetical protein